MSDKNSFFDRFTQDPKLAKLLHQEETVLEVTELICELMESRRVTRSQLATLLGKTKGYVSQLLDGKANMTLKTLGDVLFALDCRLVVKAVALDTGDVAYDRDAWSQVEYVVNQLDSHWSSIPFGQRESQYDLAG
jgi:transcriptional regulator with XRE-family HTH domain